MSLNVYIDGDKSGFNSKAAVDKFKTSVKKSNDVNVVELANKYINKTYKLELVSKNDTEVRFNLSKLQVETVSDKDKRDMLRAKLNLMKNNRTNSDVHKARTSDVVPEDILREYTKLKRVSKMPIPEPSEVLSKPDEYKPMLAMVLGNEAMRQLGQSHPYVRYFRLLAEKLGVEAPLPVPTRDYSQMLAPTEQKQVKGNEMKNYETDSDTEEEEDTS
jgi:hypothetical protein